MSKRKAMVPSVFIPGARRVLDKLGKPVTDNRGRPIWQKAKPVEHTLHFKNEAAKRRAMQAAAERGTTVTCPEEAIPLANTRDLIKVPLYRGIESELANHIRYCMREKKPVVPEMKPNYVHGPMWAIKKKKRSVAAAVAA